MIPRPDFAHHRRRVLDHLADDEAVLCFAAPHVLRNGDSEYRYRPDSDLYWLSGWEDPEAVVFLRPGEEPLAMFVQPRDPERETWTGRRAGPEGAREQFGADVAWSIEELPEQLGRLLQGVRVLHHAFGRDPEHDKLLMGIVNKVLKQGRKTGLCAPSVFPHPDALLAELRLHKSADEVAVLREAARISAEAQVAAMAATRPGLREFQVEATLHRVWLEQGSTGPGYTPIVAAGANATVLHYVTNRDELHDGDLLLVDAGCEVSWYTADITRTWPVGGRFSPAQRDVYAAVLDAQEQAIDRCRVGVGFDEVHDVTVRALTGAMIELGLLEGPVDDRIEDGSFKRYYMHGTSHWLGLDVHDVGAYARDGRVRPLADGMVLTVEPGLYVPEGDEDAPEGLRGIGVRIEDDVLVTDGQPDVLTRAVPKAIDEVEAACA